MQFALPPSKIDYKSVTLKGFSHGQLDKHYTTLIWWWRFSTCEMHTQLCATRLKCYKWHEIFHSQLDKWEKFKNDIDLKMVHCNGDITFWYFTVQRQEGFPCAYEYNGKFFGKRDKREMIVWKIFYEPFVTHYRVWCYTIIYNRNSAQINMAGCRQSSE